MLIDNLKSDLAAAEEELRALDVRKRVVEWKVDYLGNLLGDAKKMAEGEFQHSKIREMICKILEDTNEPLSATGIAERAIARGYPVTDRELARSRIAAVIAKNMQCEPRRFLRVRRGAYALIARTSEDRC